MKLRAALLVVLSTFFCSLSLHARQDVSTPTETAAFVAGLDACSAAKVRTPHPLMTSFIVEHTVLGTQADKCGYRQTMPGKMTMVCALTAEGRRSLAADLKMMTTGGRMSGGTSSAAPLWSKECEIELPDGKRIPVAQPK
jgi:hypothetical protein